MPRIKVQPSYSHLWSKVKPNQPSISSSPLSHVTLGSPLHLAQNIKPCLFAFLPLQLPSSLPSYISPPSPLTPPPSFPTSRTGEGRPAAPPLPSWLPQSTATREGCSIALHRHHRPSTIHLLAPPHHSPWWEHSIISPILFSCSSLHIKNLRWCIVDPRWCLPVVCVAVLAASFPAVDEIGVPSCLVVLIMKLFGRIVGNILEHASVKWFIHMSCKIIDIIITVPSVPAVQSDCRSELFWRSLLFHCPNRQDLEPTYSWHTWTWSHKLFGLFNPWWPSYRCGSVCHPQCPNSSPTCSYSLVPRWSIEPSDTSFG